MEVAMRPFLIACMLAVISVASLNGEEDARGLFLRTGGPAQASTGVPQGAAAQLSDLIKDWRMQKDGLVKLAEAMPEEVFSYKPTPAQRDYGEQIMHIAVGNVELMKLLGPRVANAPFTIESAKNMKTKAQILKALSDAYDFGSEVLQEQTGETINTVIDVQVFGPSTRARIVWSLLAHAMDIYGQMVVYVRLNGIVPPASRGI
jgi:DinB family